jgi:anti-sigma regulatory factor (Ser/Thr protein kinase)
MNPIALTRPAELHACRVRLAAGPAAAAEARRQVRAAIRAWELPVDPGVAVLLTSELVTNAIAHEASGTITLAIARSRGQLRVDVHDTSCSLPVLVDAPADAEAGRGLMLVALLSADWGAYHTPAGKAVYFTLACQPDVAGYGERGPARGSDVGTVSQKPSPAVHGPRPSGVGPIPSPRRAGAQRCLTGDVDPRMDVELLQDVGDVGRDGPPG